MARTSDLIKIIKIQFINSEQKLKLKELAEQYNVPYQTLKNASSKGKWKKEREQILAQREQGSYFQPVGGKELLSILGEVIIPPILLLSEMTEDTGKYFYNGENISLGKIQEYLKTVDLTVKEVQSIYEFISPTNRIKVDLALAKLGIQMGNTDSDYNVSDDSFIQALRGGNINE